MSFVLIKIGNRGFTPVQVSFGRMLFGLLALAPVLLAQRGRLPRDRARGVTSPSRRARQQRAVHALRVRRAARRLAARGDLERHDAALRARRRAADAARGAPDARARARARARLRRRARRARRMARDRRRRARRQRRLPRRRRSSTASASRTCAATSRPAALSVPALAFGQLAMGTLQLALVLPFAGGVPDCVPGRPAGGGRARSARPGRAPPTCSTTRSSATRARPRPRR